MFDASSRYAALAQASITVAQGDGTQRTLVYKKRRFLPDTSALPTLVEHTVTQGERVDHIAARYLSDATLYWQLCDANRVMRPEDLTRPVGQVIRVVLQSG